MPEPYQEIREALRKAIAPRRLRTVLWVDMVQQGYAKLVAEGRLSMEDFILIYERREETLFPPKRSPGRRSYGEQRSDARARALSEIVALRLGHLFRIGDFRRRYLDEKLLRLEEVPAWIEGQARADGPPADSYLRLPLNIRNGQRSPLLGLTRQEFADLLRDEAARLETDPECELPSTTPERHQTLSYPTGSGAVRVVEVRGQGGLAELKWLAHACSEGMRSGWSEDEAVAFILCDLIPWVVKGSIRALPGFVPAVPLVAFELHPRVAPSELVAAYVRARASFIIGRESRKMAAKQAALAVFVEETRPSGEGWTALRERWNTAHPEHRSWRYPVGADPQARRFALDARGAWMRVTGEAWSDRRRSTKR